jgi:glycosyltransferase involved in cell wall biosynthesis
MNVAIDVTAVILAQDAGVATASLLGELREDLGTRLQLVVVDRGSVDGTQAVLSEHPDVEVVTIRRDDPPGVAIDRGIALADRRSDILLLTPAVSLDVGAVSRMVNRLRAAPQTGAVAPLVRSPAGDLLWTQGREPTAFGRWGERLWGERWAARPAPLSGWVRDPRAYAWARPVPEVRGGVLLLTGDALRAVGRADDRYTADGVLRDMQRRLRATGRTIWFEPAAGASLRTTLEPVDTARLAHDRAVYDRTHRSRAVTALSGSRREAGSTPHPPRASVRVAEDGRDDDFPTASIIIPAHNEASVIDRTLAPLAPLAASGRLEVLVVCNGCDDDTAERARAYPGVRVLESDVPSKVAALNTGDAYASFWPRIYLDADICATAPALAPVIRALGDGGALAGRPPFVVDDTDASPLVRSYQRARRRMPSMSAALWGAGIYALSADGHARLGRFPDVIADDLYVDQLFTSREKAFPAAPPVRVTSPRTVRALLTVLTRSRRGPAQQGTDTGSTSVRDLLRTVRGPGSALDALVYVLFAAAARLRARRRATTTWERDDSSRHPAGFRQVQG